MRRLVATPSLGLVRAPVRVRVGEAVVEAMAELYRPDGTVGLRVTSRRLPRCQLAADPAGVGVEVHAVLEPGLQGGPVGLVGGPVGDLGGAVGPPVLAASAAGIGVAGTPRLPAPPSGLGHGRYSV